MPHLSVGMLGIVVAVALACCERGVNIVVQAASRRGASAAIRFINKSGEREPPARLYSSPLRSGSAQCDDEDQRGEGADSAPNPFLPRETRGLQLVQMVRQLMQVLRRELRYARIH